MRAAVVAAMLVVIGCASAVHYGNRHSGRLDLERLKKEIGTLVEDIEVLKEAVHEKREAEMQMDEDESASATVTPTIAAVSVPTTAATAAFDCAPYDHPGSREQVCITLHFQSLCPKVCEGIEATMNDEDFDCEPYDNDASRNAGICQTRHFQGLCPKVCEGIEATMNDEEKREASNWAQSCVDAHNKYRALHQNTPAVTWNTNLADESRSWAKHLVNISRMEHSTAKTFGENLYWMSGGDVTCEQAVKKWYDEIVDYDWTTGGSLNGNAVGHFTQVVWKSTTEIGMALAKSATGATYVVARYTPKGNFIMMQMGETYNDAKARVYGDEVQPLAGTVQPTVTNCSATNPCGHNGWCDNGVCKCPLGVSGAMCETEVTKSYRSCSSGPCRSGEICYDYACPGGISSCVKCVAGGNAATTPKPVQPTTKPSDPCNNNPCNAGNCTSWYSSYRSMYDYYCSCDSAYTGKNCDVYKLSGPCTTMQLPCGGNGKCYDWYDNYYSHSSNTWKKYCYCQNGYSGKNCTISPPTAAPTSAPKADPCDTNPCVGGNCSSWYSSYSKSYSYWCRCPKGFTGKHCQMSEASGPCSLNNPCRNNATCSEWYDDYYTSSSNTWKYYCMCKAGFSGTNCTDAPACHSNPCMNGGTCHNGYYDKKSFTCSCPAGFKGKTCSEVASNPCDNQPCQNGGTCNSPSYYWQSGYYFCSCAAGFKGQNCTETKPTEAPRPCSLKPCKNNGTCGEYYSSYRGSYRHYCNCKPGFGGKSCEKITADPCLNQPCQNGGNCSSPHYYWGTGYYWCYCPSGFRGKNCTEMITTPRPTSAPVRCTSGKLDWSCCTRNNKCGENQGDCDRDSDCKAGLKCGNNNCQRSKGWNRAADCCYKPAPATAPPPKDCSGQRHNDWHCCTATHKCGVNEGDCDSDRDCKFGLKCGTNNCPQRKGYKFQLTADCCYKPAATTIRPTTVPSKPCDSNPCQNNGTCNNRYYNRYYRCSCKEGFGGKNCEKIVTDPCLNQPCQNGGTCNSPSYYWAYNYYWCKCLPGFKGKNCTHSLTTQAPVTKPTTPAKFDACSSQPCQNNGTCNSYYDSYNKVSRFYCRCANGFTGKTCDISKSDGPCTLNNPCQNNSTCSDYYQDYYQDQPHKWNYYCRCPKIYSGKNCSEMNPCNVNPCKNQGRCYPTDPKWNYGINHRCSCRHSHVGQTCETPRSQACQGSPCGDHGKCRASSYNSRGYYCSCNQNVTGPNCKISKSEGPCAMKRAECNTQNTNSCQDWFSLDNWKYHCNCKRGFHGKRCDSKYGLVAKREMVDNEMASLMENFEKLKRDLEELKDPEHKRPKDQIVGETEFKEHMEHERKEKERHEKEEKEAQDEPSIMAASENEFLAHQQMMNSQNNDEPHESAPANPEEASDEEFRAFQNMIDNRERMAAQQDAPADAPAAPAKDDDMEAEEYQAMLAAERENDEQREREFIEQEKEEMDMEKNDEDEEAHPDWLDEISELDNV